MPRTDPMRKCLKGQCPMASWHARLCTILGGLMAICGAGCTSLPAPRGLAGKGTVLVVPSGPAEPLSYVTPREPGEAMERGLWDGMLAATSPGGVFLLPLTLGIGAAQGLRGKD